MRNLYRERNCSNGQNHTMKWIPGLAWPDHCFPCLGGEKWDSNSCLLLIRPPDTGDANRQGVVTSIPPIDALATGIKI